MDRKGQTWKDGSGAVALVLSTTVREMATYHEVLILECSYDRALEGTKIKWSEVCSEGVGLWDHKRSPMKRIA
jgi:hypothetical protein